MAPGIFSRLLGGSSRSQRRQESWSRAQRTGPPGVLESLNPLSGGKRDDYTLERRRRRDEIRQNFYRSSRKKLVKKRRHAERNLKDDLRRQQEKIDGYYRRKEKSLGLERARERASDKFKRTEREMMRKFRKTWQDQESDLKRQRDSKYRQVTKEMHRELREAQGLPNQPKLPWS